MEVEKPEVFVKWSGHQNTWKALVFVTNTGLVEELLTAVTQKTFPFCMSVGYPSGWKTPA